MSSLGVLENGHIIQTGIFERKQARTLLCLLSFAGMASQVWFRQRAATKLFAWSMGHCTPGAATWAAPMLHQLEPRPIAARVL